MKKRPFLYLTQSDVLDKIDIDPRLVNAFLNVMKKMDSYFLVNDYYELKDYKKFFEDYLIDKNFSIQCNDEPSKIGALGFYNKNSNRIVVDISCLDTQRLESVLCHEFIHFIVMYDLIKHTHDKEIVNGGFFNEALTEMLTQQIYPDSRAYEPQVKMVTFSNLISGQVNNYRCFLKGYWPGPGSSWTNYLAAANDYYNKYFHKGYRLREAIKDEDYINAQRCAIDAFVRNSRLTDFDKYLKLLENLDSRPVEDQEYIDRILCEKEKQLISSVYGNDSPVFSYLMKQFEILKRIKGLIVRYDGKPVYRFSINGRDLAIDKDGKLYGDYYCRPGSSFSTSFDKSKGIVSLWCGGEEKVLDLNKLYFADFADTYNKRCAQLRKYFINSPKKDIEMISRFKDKAKDLVRIEKFILPSIRKKNKSVVYVATYTDGIEVLNGFPPLEYKDSYRCAEFIGYTSPNFEKSPLVSKNTRTLENGVVYSTCELPFVKWNAIKKIAKMMLDTMDDVKKEDIFSQYKTSDSYDDGDTLLDALVWYVKNNYDSLDKDELHKVYLEVLDENQKVIVGVNNGVVEVSYAFADFVSFVCDRQVLVDEEQDAIFNSYFINFNTDLVNEDRESCFVPFDENGNLEPGKVRDLSKVSHLF